MNSLNKKRKPDEDSHRIGTKKSSTQETEARKRKVLIFTDSRGQHKPAGQTHDIFAERLAKDPRFEVDAYLCPMKWTTTLDFLEQFTADELSQYDHVILYTGIVEWSPRKLSNAREDLYNPKNTENLGNLSLNTRDYSQKIINNKKEIFDSIFGEGVMAQHFDTPFDTEYEGEKTINMYPLERVDDNILPRLTSIPNLIFINANRFVPGWRGDYKKERPENMSVVHQYSRAFANGFPPDRIIDLLQWSEDDVRIYTCDNLHLSEAGSDWIYENLMKKIGMPEMKKSSTTAIDWPEYSFTGFAPIERMNRSKIDVLTKRVDREGKNLATLIIGVRLDDRNPERTNNLRFLLEWLDYHYQDMFDILLVEQDSEPKIKLSDLNAKPNVRHEFLFNPKDFNRGWGYNVAVKSFCEDAEVIALMDTDVLTGSGFVSDIISCFKKYDVVSPYLNVYYTEKEEAGTVASTKSLSTLNNQKHIKNPVTVSGGIVIFNRATYMALKGFEQYIGYACEDRALDVTIFNHIDPKRVRLSPETYVHMWHPSDEGARKNFKQIYAHLQENYSCTYDPSVKPFEFIHKNCRHASKAQTTRLLIERSRSFGDPTLYSSGKPLTINGQFKQTARTWDENDGPIFPPAYKGLQDYSSRELYPDLPQADVDELRSFYNCFQGERCFIIGNGPSLNKHDLSLLEGEYSFGVNSFYYKTRDTGYRPTFYVVEDNSVMKENLQEIKSFEAPFKFFPTLYKRLHPKAPNTFFFEMNRGFYEKSSPNYVVPRFSTDASKVLYCGQSVTYINLQLAFFMGFTEVYLIGMDFDYVIPKSHKRTGDVLLSDSDDPNHFHKDYFGKGKTWKDPKLDRVLLNYRMADLAYSAVGRKIYNATVGGRLEVFDRVDYEALLRDPATGKRRETRIDPPVTAPGSMARQQGLKDAPGTAPMPMSPTTVNASQLASRLLLDPAEMLPRVEAGGDLAFQVQQLLAADGPAAAHLRKAMAWARAAVTETA